MRKTLVVLAALIVLSAGGALAQGLTPMEELGKFLFFDTNLSTPARQSCAACHAPEVGFTGPDSDINATQAIYPGAVHTRAGNRKPPTAAYGGFSPVLYYDEVEELWIGGMFWDGRATGWTLGDPLAEQAQGPFLNPLEQNNPNPKLVCIKVRDSEYADLFEEVWGPGSLNFVTDEEVAETYERIARSISAYEQSAEVNPFTSKFDYFLAGGATLTPEEEWGLELFEGEAMCSACHISEPGPNGEPPLFTDFTYDNLGVPRNLSNPFYDMPRRWNPDGEDWIDPGLGGFLAAAGFDDHVADNWGKHKVPTLRNVDMRPYPEFVKAYAHNGFFTSLEEIVHFYNTRDVETWPDPEVEENVNTDELGNLGLTSDEEAALVAFMKTLTDGYVAPPVGAQVVALSPVALDLAIPNPVTPTTDLTFSLTQAGNVELDVYNILGRRVANLAGGWHDAGDYNVHFATQGLPSGVYFIRLANGEEVLTKKLALIR